MKKVALAVLLITAAIFVACQKSPTLPETSKLRVLSAYKTGLMAQAEAQRANAFLEAKGKAYQDVVQQELDANHYPKGSSVQIDLDKDTVIVVAPAPPPANQPAPATKSNVPAKPAK